METWESGDPSQWLPRIYGGELREQKDVLIYQYYVKIARMKPGQHYAVVDDVASVFPTWWTRHCCLLL